MKTYEKYTTDLDLTDEIIYLERQKREAAKKLSEEQVYHMIWYGKKAASTLGIICGHIEKRDVDVEEIFMMFPEISPAFFKNFNLNEFTFRFTGGTVTFIRKES